MNGSGSLFFFFSVMLASSLRINTIILLRSKNLITSLTIIWTIAFVWIRLEQEKSGIPYVDGGWLENGILHNEMTILAYIIHSFRMVLVLMYFLMECLLSQCA